MELSGNINLNKLVIFDDELFSYYGVKIENISFVSDDSTLNIYGELESTQGNKIKNDLMILFAFYSENGIENVTVSYVDKGDFFKGKLIREEIYFKTEKKLVAFKSKIKKITVRIEKN